MTETPPPLPRERDILLRVIDFETSNTPENNGEILETAYTDVIICSRGSITLLSPATELFGIKGEIAPEAQAAHHIWKSDLPSWTLFSITDGMALLQCEAGTTRMVDYLVAHNSKFETDMLALYSLTTLPPVICTMKIARRIYPDLENYNLQYLRYKLNIEQDIRDENCSPPHRAGPDTWLTARLFSHLFSKQEGNVTSILENFHTFTLAPLYYARCPLGKYKGQPWASVDSGYLSWMLRAPDMDPDLKAAARGELNLRTYPKW